MTSSRTFKSSNAFICAAARDARDRPLSRPDRRAQARSGGGCQDEVLELNWKRSVLTKRCRWTWTTSRAAPRSRLPKANDATAWRNALLRQVIHRLTGRLFPCEENSRIPLSAQACGDEARRAACGAEASLFWRRPGGERRQCGVHAMIKTEIGGKKNFYVAAAAGS